MASSRLFVALLPPITVRTELAALAEPLASVRWTPADNLHLTMRFIGDTTDERQAAMVTALTRVRVEPFILPVAGVGVFPSRGPAKVLWAGVGRAHTRLFQLRKQIDDALLSVDLSLDVHSFHPHFTLGRIGETYDAKALAEFTHRHRNLEAPPFRITEFHLMASDLSPGRPPAYRSVHRFSLDA